MKILHATSGPIAGNSYELGPSTVIGRDGEVDIQVLDDGVSRRHACVVENEDGSFSVIDLGWVLLADAMDGHDVSISDRRGTKGDPER